MGGAKERWKGEAGPSNQEESVFPARFIDHLFYSGISFAAVRVSFCQLFHFEAAFSAGTLASVALH